MTTTSMTTALAISVMVIPFLWLPWYLISTGEILDVLAGKKSFQPFYWRRESGYDIFIEQRKPRLISPGIRNDDARGAGLGFYVSSSFFLTVVAMVIGHHLDPTEAVPRTRQMFLANLICDAVTLTATTELLRIAYTAKRRFAVLAALILNVAIAAFLAVLSLWSGTVRTAMHVTWREAIRVLLGFFPDGSRRSFGAYFWTMHTAFIPIAACLVVVFLAYGGRVLLRPAEWLVGKGSEVEKPVQLTGVLFTVAAASMAVFSAVVQIWIFLSS